jgi:hypothetical protein
VNAEPSVLVGTTIPQCSPLFLTVLRYGSPVGAPQVCPAARRYAPSEAFALDKPSAGVIIGA